MNTVQKVIKEAIEDRKKELHNDYLHKLESGVLIVDTKSRKYYLKQLQQEISELEEFLKEIEKK